jgi:hypothetical protein
MNTEIKNRKRSMNFFSIVKYSTFILIPFFHTLYLGIPLVANAEKPPIPKQINNIASAQTLQMLNGTWEGTYICGQGLTKLRLSIKAKTPTNIDAVFVFSAHVSNPTVPSGSFRMKGVYQSLDSEDVPDTLELRATQWISRPRGYQTVNLQGTISPSEKRMVGNVSASPSCSKFDLVKVEK